jgi:hypothetical protein
LSPAEEITATFLLLCNCFDVYASGFSEETANSLLIWLSGLTDCDWGKAERGIFSFRIHGNNLSCEKEAGNSSCTTQQRARIYSTIKFTYSLEH